MDGFYLEVEFLCCFLCAEKSGNLKDMFRSCGVAAACFLFIVLKSPWPLSCISGVSGRKQQF